jgi:cation:H+ antiporter
MFEDAPTTLLIGVFVVCMGVVWFFGSRLARHVGEVADRYGIGGPAAGLLILAPITSLPEIATTSTAAVQGAGDLAVNAVLGSAALQVMFIACADFAIGRSALTAQVPSRALMAQAAMSVIILIVAAAGIVSGDFALLGVGVWPALVFAVFVATPFIAGAADRAPRRDAVSDPDPDPRDEDVSTKVLIINIVIAAAAVLTAGAALASSGEALAERSGLGQSFFGFLFVGLSTSLPELSSAIAAARLKRMDMAIADVFGGNLVNTALIFTTDWLYPKSPVLNELGAFSIFGALLASVLTLVFMLGMIERRDRSVLRMGYDSVAVLLIAVAGMAVLYQLR